MRKSHLARVVAFACASFVISASAWAQDRNAFRSHARQTAEQMRSLGEPMDRCAFGGVIQKGVVIEVFEGSPLSLGDRFTSFNGTDVSAMSDEQIVALARTVGPDAQIPIAVERAGEVVTLDVACSNARAFMEPMLTALDQARRGRFSDCVETLASRDDSSSLALRFQCASLTRRPEDAGAGDMAHQLAVRAIDVAHAIPERRSAAIDLLRRSEAMIMASRGGVAFRELVDATRRWPGDEDAWERSEPDWGAFRRNAEAALTQRLVDPESARFEWPNGFRLGGWRPFMGSTIEGYWTCGLINARNRMGGYTGSAAFVAVLSPEGQVLYVDMGEARDFDMLSNQCANSVGLLPPAPHALTSADAPAPPTVSSPSIADELERLVRLRDSGALTDAEFEAAKDQLLGTTPE